MSKKFSFTVKAKAPTQLNSKVAAAFVEEDEDEDETQPPSSSREIDIPLYYREANEETESEGEDEKRRCANEDGEDSFKLPEKRVIPQKVRERCNCAPGSLMEVIMSRRDIEWTPNSRADRTADSRNAEEALLCSSKSPLRSSNTEHEAEPKREEDEEEMKGKRESFDEKRRSESADAPIAISPTPLQPDTSVPLIPVLPVIPPVRTLHRRDPRMRKSALPSLPSSSDDGGVLGFFSEVLNNSMAKTCSPEAPPHAAEETRNHVRKSSEPEVEIQIEAPPNLFKECLHRVRGMKRPAAPQVETLKERVESELSIPSEEPERRIESPRTREVREKTLSRPGIKVSRMKDPLSLEGETRMFLPRPPFFGGKSGLIAGSEVAGLGVSESSRTSGRESREEDEERGPRGINPLFD